MSNSPLTNSIDYLLMEKKSTSKLSSLITNHIDIKSILDSLPYIAALLDSERRIVYANEVFTQFLDRDSIYQVLELLPGEALECSNHTKTGKLCGTSRACNYCGMRTAIEDSRNSKGKITSECVITRNDSGREISIDYRVTASTLILAGEFYTMLTLVDISHEKRRRVLERIFFHDILNKAGSLTGIVDLTKEFDDLDQVHKQFKVIDLISHGIVEEIEAQRLLMDAESGELEIHDTFFNTIDIIDNVKTQLSQHTVGINKKVIFNENSPNVRIFSDPVLLKRILINMLKNALEASDEGSTIEIGCNKNGNVMMFHVKNEQVMPEHVQMQIFHRSYSTKGRNRGLGTYSMKLLGEQYLQGRVFFESNHKNGTTFYLAIPISKSNFEN